MGAKNHQPCNKYLATSTMWSRAASTSYASLELANVELENLILSELNGDTGDVRRIVSLLESSTSALQEFLLHGNSLKSEMVAKEFVDMDSLSTVDLETLGKTLSCDGVVDHNSWNQMVALMSEGGFLSVLSYFQAQGEHLLALTGQAHKAVASIAHIAPSGRINNVLEENLSGNIKAAFARLYVSWARFQSEFLTSSILSTELWYASQGYGSLCPEIQSATA